LKEVSPRVPTAEATGIAPVAVHGDFWARNILIRDGRVSGVVDWEAAQMSGPPWQDPFDFAMHLAAEAPEWRQRSATDRIRDALFGSGASARALRAFFTAWRAAARVEREMLPRFLDLYLDDAAVRGGKEKSGGWRSSIPWDSIRAEAARRDLFVFSG
jgi:aminoglycoside phosphotransferase (APT) family kinase protein